MSTDSGLLWVVCAAHPHSEAIAVEHLARQGFSPYCPMVRKRRSHARRVDMVLRPLFPGYVFVGLAESGRWRSILSTRGVRSLVRFGEQPALIDGAFIKQLRVRELDGAVVRPAVPYAVGQNVQISDGGPFHGLVAKILDLDEKDRITVLLDVMNRAVRTQLDALQVSPAVQE